MRLAAIILLSFAIILIAGCTNSGNLGSVEVNEYNGVRLDSISDAYDTSIKGTQDIDISKYALEISGMVKKPLNLTYDEVISHDSYRKIVTLNCVEGWSARILWEGVLVKDLLDEAGINPEADTVIFYAYDGYTTSLPLDYIIKNNIMLAYRMNNVTLPPSKGFPFQLVAEDKWGYKWIKWVTRIEISNNSTYLGYWESRGWGNDATVEKTGRTE